MSWREESKAFCILSSDFDVMQLCSLELCQCFIIQLNYMLLLYFYSLSVKAESVLHTVDDLNVVSFCGSPSVVA